MSLACSGSHNRWTGKFKYHSISLLHFAWLNRRTFLCFLYAESCTREAFVTPVVEDQSIGIAGKQHLSSEQFFSVYHLWRAVFFAADAIDAAPVCVMSQIDLAADMVPIGCLLVEGVASRPCGEKNTRSNPKAPK